MVNVLKFLTLFCLMLVTTAEINKMLVRLAHREDPDQTASSALFVYAFLADN